VWHNIAGINPPGRANVVSLSSEAEGAAPDWVAEDPAAGRAKESDRTAPRHHQTFQHGPESG